MAGGNSAAGLSSAITSWENNFGESVEGYQTPEGFAYGLEHPVIGKPYNTANPNYESDLVKLAKTMEAYMQACGVQ
jgi:hypothetical protein